MGSCQMAEVALILLLALEEDAEISLTKIQGMLT